MSATLSPRLNEILLHHLQTEEAVLYRMQEFAHGLTDKGFHVLSLVERQAGLTRLLNELVELQMHRQGVCHAIAQVCRCEPGAVRLSQLNMGSPAANESFHRRREKLAQLAINTRVSLQTADQTLRGWSGIVNFVLGEVLGATATSDRYGARGQRLPSSQISSIDVRS